MTTHSLLQHCEWSYEHADMLDRHKYEYEFGGGHPTPYLPWVKIDPKSLAIVPAKGPDCSGGVSNILWTGGILGTPASKSAPDALSTRQLESWGAAGKGQYLTVWVINLTGLEHCFLEFTIPGKTQHWWAAPHTGEICGWQNYKYWDPAQAGYKPRHPVL